MTAARRSHISECIRVASHGDAPSGICEPICSRSIPNVSVLSKFGLKFARKSFLIEVNRTGVCHGGEQSGSTAGLSGRRWCLRSFGVGLLLS